MKGRIKTYVPGRGFGFITGEDRKDYFFHVKNVSCALDELRVGSGVEFDPEIREKGPAARVVMKSKDPEGSSSPNGGSFSTVIKIGDNRYRIDSISKYEIIEGVVLLRHRVKQRGFVEELIGWGEGKEWYEHEYKILCITFKGYPHYFFSDTKLESHRHNENYESKKYEMVSPRYIEIRDLKFIDEDVIEVCSKLDQAFGTF